MTKTNTNAKLCVSLKSAEIAEVEPMEDKNNRINCLQCAHFMVTWEPKFPKACRLFGFKSAGLPSVAVYESTGAACMGFAKKEVEKRKD